MTSVPPGLTIAEAGRLIAAKKLSPVELAKALLARIKAVDPRINAFLTVTERAALAAARAAERAVMAGGKGPLLGIPVAYKDIYETAGVPTTAHSRILQGNVPKQDAETVRRLREAGVVMLGKLATHEFAIGGPAFDLPWPPARNPWDPRRFTGGSSSGSAAAVASGLALGALGSDTGGSIRLPAAYCGIAGLKPTPGLVSRRGVIPLAPSLDTAGPMAWTAQDCAILLDALAGHDPADPASVPGPNLSYANAIAAPVKGLRVGVLRHVYEHDMPAGPEVRHAMAHAIAVLKSLGCRVEDATLPRLQEYNAVGRVIISAEAYALHEATLQTRLSEYSRAFRIRVLPGALVRAAEYIAAQRRRADLIAITAKAFRALRRADLDPHRRHRTAAERAAPRRRLRPAAADHAGECRRGAVAGGLRRLYRRGPAARPRDHRPGLGRCDGAAGRPSLRAGSRHPRPTAGDLARPRVARTRRPAATCRGRRPWHKPARRRRGGPERRGELCAHARLPPRRQSRAAERRRPSWAQPSRPLPPLPSTPTPKTAVGRNSAAPSAACLPPPCPARRTQVDAHHPARRVVVPPALARRRVPPCETVAWGRAARRSLGRSWRAAASPPAQRPRHLGEPPARVPSHVAWGLGLARRDLQPGGMHRRAQLGRATLQPGRQLSRQMRPEP